MAFLQADVGYGNPTLALTGGAARTVCGVLAPTNQAIKILEASISFDGNTSTFTPVVVDFFHCTFATNKPGTNSTSVTPTKRDPGRGETVQTQGGKGWTTEPTVVGNATIPDRTIDVPQFGGLYHYINPFASPYIVAGASGFAIRANSPNNVNTSGALTFEE